MSDEEFNDFSDGLDGIISEALVTDTYLCDLEDVKRIEAKDGKKYNVFEWEVIQVGDFEGEAFSDMFRHASLDEYNKADKKEKREIREARRSFRARLMSLGVPENELSTVKPSSLVGIKAHITVDVKPRTKGTGFNVWVKALEIADLSKETSNLSF